MSSCTNPVTWRFVQSRVFTLFVAFSTHGAFWSQAIDRVSVVAWIGVTGQISMIEEKARCRANSESF